MINCLSRIEFNYCFATVIFVFDIAMTNVKYQGLNKTKFNIFCTSRFVWSSNQNLHQNTWWLWVGSDPKYVLLANIIPRVRLSSFIMVWAPSVAACALFKPSICPPSAVYNMILSDDTLMDEVFRLIRAYGQSTQCLSLWPTRALRCLYAWVDYVIIGSWNASAMFGVKSLLEKKWLFVWNLIGSSVDEICIKTNRLPNCYRELWYSGKENNNVNFLYRFLHCLRFPFNPKRCIFSSPLRQFGLRFIVDPFTGYNCLTCHSTGDLCAKDGRQMFVAVQNINRFLDYF